eukprot:TRINITY_DN467_c0_g1_i1.p1 TRINITY_DN467_c0_g1~~TRINITY_DN467_c0_g1_i1.p1  ORF type:complete len:370 (-),score=59.88 TRINITY_DN467_c0_g1_i1:47-1075(-)
MNSFLKACKVYTRENIELHSAPTGLVQSLEDYVKSLKGDHQVGSPKKTVVAKTRIKNGGRGSLGKAEMKSKQPRVERKTIIIGSPDPGRIQSNTETKRAASMVVPRKTRAKPRSSAANLTSITTTTTPKPKAANLPKPKKNAEKRLSGPPTLSQTGFTFDPFALNSTAQQDSSHPATRDIIYPNSTPGYMTPQGLFIPLVAPIPSGYPLQPPVFMPNPFPPAGNMGWMGMPFPPMPGTVSQPGQTSSTAPATQTASLISFPQSQYQAPPAQTFSGTTFLDINTQNSQNGSTQPNPLSGGMPYSSFGTGQAAPVSTDFSSLYVGDSQSTGSNQFPFSSFGSSS